MLEQRAPWGYPDCQFTRTLQENHREKMLIARYAVENCVQNGDSLLVDMGTTATIFAHELARSPWRGLQVGTHSLSVAIELLGSPVIEERRGCRVFGGFMYAREAGVFPFPDDRIRRWDPFDGAEYTAVMTIESITFAGGAATTREQIQRLNRHYIAGAKQVLMLADHSKFLKRARPNVTMCGLGPDGKWLKRRVEFKLITDTLWGPLGEPPEFGRVSEHPAIRFTKGSGAFDKIAVLEAALYPKSATIY